MSDDLTNVPRRLRRYYRHGEPVPEGEEKSGDANPVKEGENHEENEPWMNAPPASRLPVERKHGNVRRENARAPAAPTNSPSSPNQNASATPKQGLFSRILHRESKPVVTPMDHALGLHDKEKFIEQTPRGSERALRHAPPAPAPSQPANSSTAARADIQKTLQELKSLAKTNTNEDKPSVSLTSFHFTPAGEAPREPEPNERVPQYPPEKTTENLSPRERAEQRRQGRGNAPAPTHAPSSSPTSSTPAPGRMANENQAAHIRRRMGQLVDNERMDKEDEPISRNSSAEMKDDEDFKSLFSDEKSKSKDAEKKKKKASADDDDMSLDDDENADLELFEDDK